MTTINAIGTQDPTEIAKGGTGQGTATAAFDALSPVTTQGDTIYRDASNNVRLAKGTANQLLAMNSGATAPEWQDAPSSDSITVTAAPTSDTTASGVKIQLTANEAQNFGDAVYLLATGKAGIADASAIATSRVFAILLLLRLEFLLCVPRLLLLAMRLGNILLLEYLVMTLGLGLLERRYILR